MPTQEEHDRFALDSAGDMQRYMDWLGTVTLADKAIADHQEATRRSDEKRHELDELLALTFGPAVTAHITAFGRWQALEGGLYRYILDGYAYSVSQFGKPRLAVRHLGNDRYIDLYAESDKLAVLAQLSLFMRDQGALAARREAQAAKPKKEPLPYYIFVRFNEWWTADEGQQVTEWLNQKYAQGYRAIPSGSNMILMALEEPIYEGDDGDSADEIPF